MTDLPHQDIDDEAFQRYLKETDPGPETLEQRRTRLDGRAETIALPTDCEVDHAEVGGVPCERLNPVGARPNRTLIYFHGGGYSIGSPRSHRYLASRLADAAYCRAIAPDYRLAPEDPFPAAVDDAMAVYRAVLENEPASGVILGGDSAGGGLALALAISARDAGLPQPAGLLLISPWIDLAHEGSTYEENADTDTTGLEGLTRFAVSYANGRDLHDPLISPLYGDLKGLAPMLIQVGTAEVLLTDSTRLAERAARAKVDVTLHAIPRLVHGFPLHFPLLAAVRRAYAEAAGWMNARFG